MTAEFVVMWSLDYLMLSGSSWGMSLDTISSSSSVSAANYFSLWSKVRFFCVNFFLHALLKFDLSSLEVVVAELSVNPRFCIPFVFDKFFTSFWSDFLFYAILILIFPSFVFFLEAVEEDALAFAIAANASVRAPGLRNLSYSADPPPETVFLSPPPSPTPSPSSLPLMHLVQVLSSS